MDFRGQRGWVIPPYFQSCFLTVYELALPSSLLQKLENPFRDGRRDIFSACINPPPSSFVTDTSHAFQEQSTFIVRPAITTLIQLLR